MVVSSLFLWDDIAMARDPGISVDHGPHRNRGLVTPPDFADERFGQIAYLVSGVTVAGHQPGCRLTKSVFCRDLCFESPRTAPVRVADSLSWRVVGTDVSFLFQYTP